MIIRMKNLNYIIAGVIVAVIIGGSFYFYLKNNSLPNPLSIFSGSNSNKLDVSDEIGKLNTLLQRSRDEKVILAEIQKQYSKAGESIKKSDVLFDNPDSANPKIKIKISNPDVEKNINAKRAEVTRILKAWDETVRNMNSYSPRDIVPNMLVLYGATQRDIAFVEDYIRELQQVVSGLTPTTSGLSQTQLDSYNSVVSIVLNEISSIVTSTAAIQAPVETYVQTYLPQIIPPTQTETVPNPEPTTNPTTNPDTGTTPQAPVLPPIVTPADIVEQQNNVTEAEEQASQNQNLNGVTQTYSPYAQNPEPQYVPNPDHEGWIDLTPSNNPGPKLIEGENPLGN